MINKNKLINKIKIYQMGVIQTPNILRKDAVEILNEVIEIIEKDENKTWEEFCKSLPLSPFTGTPHKGNIT